MRKRIAVIVTCGLLISACGSSGSPSSSTGKAGAHDQFLAFSRCMRSHGVSNFPDPHSTGSGGIQLGGNLNPQSPAFQSAQASCKHLLPGGGPSSGHPSAQAKAQMLRVSECMRKHGISGFPDPTTKPPSSPAANTQVVGRGGVFLVIPNSIDTQSPAFEQAAAACHFGPRGAAKGAIMAR